MADRKYIVIFKDTTTKDQIDAFAERVLASGGRIFHRHYRNDNPIFYGLTATIPDRVYSSFQNDDLVEDIEADEEVGF